MADIPKPWRNPASLISVLAAIVGTTVATMAWAGAQVRTVARDEAAKAAAPVASELSTHRLLDDQRAQFLQQRLDALQTQMAEQNAKLDLLLRRSSR